MKKAGKKFCSLAALCFAVALTFSSAAVPTGTVWGTEVYAAAHYDSTQMEEYAREVAIIVNREREKQGLEPLKFSDQLSEVANLRSNEIQTLFAHTRPDGTSCFTAMDEAGIDYYYGGENIAYGQKTPEAVMTAWMNSQGHKDNILSEEPNYLGVGVTYNNNRYYWVQLFAWSNNLDGDVPADPEAVVRITGQPANVIGKLGDTVSLHVTATGSGLSYQWMLSDDQGQTWRNSSTKSATYSVTLGANNDGRCVRCIVSDRYGNRVLSDVASMKIAVVTITRQPADVRTGNGTQAHFMVKASGEGLAYQWQLSDDQGETWRNSSVKTANYYVTLSEKNNGRYVRCVVTDKYGTSVTSDAAEMRITPVRITAQPANVTASIGKQVTFSVKAKGDGLGYQWQLSDDQGKTWRSSSTKSTGYVTTLSEKNAGRYVRCIVTDQYGNQAVSAAAWMKPVATAITTQPVNASASLGGQVTFTVGAVGEGLSYQWQLSDDQGKTWRGSSVKTAQYVTTLSEKNNGRYVRCIVTDKTGKQLVSNAAVMKVK